MIELIAKQAHFKLILSEKGNVLLFCLPLITDTSDCTSSPEISKLSGVYGLNAVPYFSKFCLPFLAYSIDRCITLEVFDAC